MADIEVVIKIPKEDYIYIAKKHCLPSCDDRTLRKNVYEMIRNGTPLPKGHGRILDEKDILNTENNDGGWYDLVDMSEYIAGVKAIIEADNTESEE